MINKYEIRGDSVAIFLNRRNGEVLETLISLCDLDGWKRVISIDNGKITFHIPDDFDIGYLPEIKPNWNGHSTAEKWDYVKSLCGCSLDK